MQSVQCLKKTKELNKESNKESDKKSNKELKIKRIK